MSNIISVVKEYSSLFNLKIRPLFIKVDGLEKRVVDAMEYSVMNGGKRLRPFLVYETSKLFDIPFEQSFYAAASLEMLHSYSLIHDDLPAMDNDDLRRGKPTCHKQFDEATAILAGDGLLTYAFEILATSPYEDKIKIELIKLLSQAAGAINGMIAGQMLDLSTERMTNITNSEFIIKHIEEMKTGCLLRYACEAGAVIGKADNPKRQALVEYSRKIGVAFQIADVITFSRHFHCVNLRLCAEPCNVTAGSIGAASAVDTLLHKPCIGFCVVIERRTAPVCCGSRRFFRHFKHLVAFVNGYDTAFQKFTELGFVIAHYAGSIFLFCILRNYMIFLHNSSDFL